MVYKLYPDIDVKPSEIIKDRKKIEKQLAILRESFGHLGYDFHWEIYPIYQDRWEDRPYKQYPKDDRTGDELLGLTNKKQKR